MGRGVSEGNGEEPDPLFTDIELVERPTAIILDFAEWGRRVREAKARKAEKRRKRAARKGKS